jgi:hypothetical protein
MRNNGEARGVRGKGILEKGNFKQVFGTFEGLNAGSRQK